MKEKDLLKKTLTVILLLLPIIICWPVLGQNNRNFTQEELSRFNGKKGKPAYVAVNGVVYDVTHIRAWANGRHYCRNAFAGKDLTPLWNFVPRSHRNPAFLKAFPQVGKLVAGATNAKPTAPKAPPISMIFLAGLFIAFMITGAWLFFNLLLRLRR